ncbi:MAG: hypothetical protein K2O11_11600 [Oscillospiraceae bacterium]|nr:hypothetical protein [Oscillospiraceae bacterium]
MTMKKPEEKLHLVMDESDAPYSSEEYTPTLEDKLILVRLAKKYGLEFEPGSEFDKLSRAMDNPGNRLMPQFKLPEKCFAALEATGETIIIHRGVMGYTPTGQYPEGMSGQEGADALNEQIGVTKAQAAAMLFGSMFGWACPGADPANYDEQGQPVKRKEDPHG